MKFSKLDTVLLTLFLLSLCYSIKLSIGYVAKDITTIKNMNSDTNKLNNNMLITAAHLGDIEGYKLLYKDEDRDVGYYIRESIELSTVELQDVTIEGLQDCKIIKSYKGGFVVATSRTDLIHSGLSGTRVKSLDGKDIGFISSLLKDGNLDCKNLE